MPPDQLPVTVGSGTGPARVRHGCGTGAATGRGSVAPECHQVGDPGGAVWGPRWGGVGVGGGRGLVWPVLTDN